MNALRDLEAPSYAARNALLFDRQVRDNGGAIWNGRPLGLLEAPIRIYHPAFARILSCMAAPLEDHRFSSEELDTASFLINALAPYYRDEDERIVAIKGLELCSPPGPKALLLLAEVKNGIGEGDRDAVMLAAYEYVALAVSDELQAPREKSCLPALILAIVGEHVVIYGAVLLDGKPVVQRLTSLVTLGATENIRTHPLTGNPDRIECGRSRIDEGTLHAARVLRALRDGVEALERYYSASASAPLPPPGTLRCHPYLTTLTSAEHGTLALQYTARLAEFDASRAVFKARMTVGEAGEKVDVAVKFTHSYHRSAHALLAGLSPPLAPRLWHCARAEDVGMCVVVMDFIDCADKWRARGTQDDEYVGTLRAAIGALHERDWVYGDLRLSNVLPAEDGIKLIDFGWCGSVGEARYPSDVNLNPGVIGWHHGVQRGGLIEKEHDRHMFKVVTGREF
ncbi:uncharacterized protein LAESUDRAFT_172773 [Laetiporus sulphureus 93-53]|uniref:Protein kinase domain-containing protein n=1 Tax=Laetiporus sulphureus 93-53 TaxID=1314785 RepID=A0A165HVU3_9APHY|nr:uncharacterized protein LAESUDRAFT_172773 [Laetiporus sulphureus 93-53]KZT12259.1 hypothetical protein LAESUDRAFT_172773 [Laetiporus sulphureus 93-53]